MESQRTIKRKIAYSGIGLHTGNETTITFIPAPVDTGVKFVRTDLSNKPEIPADITHVVDIARGTTIGRGEVKIHTVEHILASLAGFKIDNLIIELNANEPPVGDGSALPLVKILNESGVELQNEPKRYYNLKEPCWAAENGALLVVLPAPEFKLSFTIDYNHPALGAQFASFNIDEETFTRQIASARTFCFLHEVESLQRRGLIKGGSLENAVVIGEKNILNETLRFPDEFVRHKILDLMGDLFLLGLPLKAHVIAVKSGHALNVKLVRKMKKFEQKSKEGAISRATSDMPSSPPLDIGEIQKILPHRYPFLLVDKILELEVDKRAVGLKNVTGNEYFFTGHFPEHPVMPGVLVVESMAQVAGTLMLSKPENRGKLAYFMGINNVKFRQPVKPGDQLLVEVKVIRLKTRTGKIRAKAFVDGKVVAEAELMFSLVQG